MTASFCVVSKAPPRYALMGSRFASSSACILGAIRTVTTQARCGVALVGVVVMATLGGCSVWHPDYYYAPYPDGRRIAPSLDIAEHAMARALAAGNTSQILMDRTAPLSSKRMKLFLASYAGHEVHMVRTNPSDDATAEEWLLVDCPDVLPTRVMLVWAWLDNAWRAYPAYHLFPINRCG